MTGATANLQELTGRLVERALGAELAEHLGYEQGQVPPAELVPVAEAVGAIVPIGAWVLRESCEIVRRIAERAGRPVELSVNVSAHQLPAIGL